MKATFKLNVPGEAEATLTCTMTINDWKRLYDQLSKSDASFWYPTEKMKLAIAAAIKKASAAYESEE